MPFTQVDVLMFEVRPKKYWILTVAIAMTLLFLASFGLAQVLNIERDTLHYLYSSIIQGFAAFVGVLFVALVFIQQRGRQTIHDVLEEAIFSSVPLVGNIRSLWSKTTPQTGVILESTIKLKDFYEKRMAPPVESLGVYLADLKGGGQQTYSSKDLNDLIASHLETLKAYNRAGALIGRYICELKDLKKQTFEILDVTFMMTAMIGLALAALLTLDSFNGASDARSTVAIFCVWLSGTVFVVSILMLKKAFVSQVQEDPSRWFSATGLPDIDPLLRVLDDLVPYTYPNQEA